MVKTMKKLIMEEGESFYDVWTKQLSDEIVSLATAYADRYMLECALNALHNDCIHKGAHNILTKCIKLHMLTLIDDNLAFYLSNSIIT